MNSAQFKTIREACGLSVPDLAKIAISPKTGLPVGERTVRYWESGGFNVPQDVINIITNLDNQLTDKAYEIADKAVSNDIQCVLKRYATNEELWEHETDFINLPATCYAAMLYRVKTLLENDPTFKHKVIIQWF